MAGPGTTSKGRAVPQLPAREIECFLTLAEELHFGRTAERMFLSQSRVSQLISALELRIGTRLVARTSRQVELTAFGTEFRASLAPVHRALTTVVEEAAARAQGLAPPLRVGFQGAIYDSVARAIRQFERDNPRTSVQIQELPLGDPFSDVLAGRVDAAVVLLPVEEPDLTVGPVFSRYPQTLAVTADDPLAIREEITAEELSRIRLIDIAGPAPEYWRRVHSPVTTPNGAVIEKRGHAHTVQEGLSQVAAGRGGLILCSATAALNPRPDIRFIPISGLAHSALGLAWRTDCESPRIRRFSKTVEDAHTPAHG